VNLKVWDHIIGTEDRQRKMIERKKDQEDEELMVRRKIFRGWKTKKIMTDLIYNPKETQGKDVV
jgi:hypothetical protein